MLSKCPSFGILSLLSILITMPACGTSAQSPVVTAAANVTYLQNNIHAQVGKKHTKASYANWTDPGRGHVVIPVNSPVEIGKRYSRGFIIRALNERRKIYFEFNSRQMGMSAEEYGQLIASPHKVNLNDLSEIDRKGVKEGKVYIGMTKKGVRIALGYPAALRTSSLEDNTWIFWRNRWRTMAIEFGGNGKVKNIRY